MREIVTLAANVNIHPLRCVIEFQADSGSFAASVSDHDSTSLSPIRDQRAGLVTRLGCQVNLTHCDGHSQTLKV